MVATSPGKRCWGMIPIRSEFKKPALGDLRVKSTWSSATFLTVTPFQVAAWGNV
jgi:hypothetical protein